MEKRTIQIKSRADNRIFINVIPGHFATNHSHINYYIDMTKIKYQLNMAREAGIQMAASYITHPIDTIVCMDGCEIIGGFMARELTKAGHVSVNSDKEIYLVTPEFNSSGQIIFRDNIQQMIWNKNVLLLLASVTTGKTIVRSLECIKYYGGNIAGISAIFSAIPDKENVEIDALFTSKDISDYHSYAFSECPDCKEKRKIDAIVNSYGYSRI